MQAGFCDSLSNRTSELGDDRLHSFLHHIKAVGNGHDQDNHQNYQNGSYYFIHLRLPLVLCCQTSGMSHCVISAWSR